jgi:hypothetical protein
MQYDQKAPIVKEDLCGIFNFRLIRELNLVIERLFIFEGDVRKEYTNPHLERQVIFRINCNDISIPIHLDISRVCIVGKTNSINQLDYGYQLENKKIVLLQTLLKEDQVRPIVIPIPQRVGKWEIVSYEPLKEPLQILCKLRFVYL